MEEKIIFASISQEYVPEYKTDGAAGGDLKAREDIIIPANGTIRVPSGLKVKMPKGYMFVIKPRSSLAVKRNLFIVDGIIDSDYRGEISIVVHNMSNEDIKVEKGERIAQGIILKLPELSFGYSMNYDKFEIEYPTERGTGGFGSTGNI